jgi:hypothetical protein
MDRETPPESEQEIDPEYEALMLYPRRRPVLKALCASALGGLLGYAGYPWIAGNRQQELADGARSVWRRMREGHRSIRDNEVASDTARSRTLPMVLDKDGLEYQVFLANLNLRHVQPLQVLRAHFKARGTVYNDLPPREIWINIAPTLRVADELCERLGVRLLDVASAYRSPAYNATCAGAASQSFHMRNMALDMVFDCTPEKVAKAAESLRTGGFFAGGIGRYPTFTHIDTRGKSVDWGGECDVVKKKEEVKSKSKDSAKGKTLARA